MFLLGTPAPAASPAYLDVEQEGDESSFEVEAVGSVVADEEKIKISDGQLRLQLEDNEKAYIYNMKGEMVFVTNRSGSFQIDNLRKGIYIVRVGNTTKKVMTK